MWYYCAVPKELPVLVTLGVVKIKYLAVVLYWNFQWKHYLSYIYAYVSLTTIALLLLLLVPCFSRFRLQIRWSIIGYSKTLKKKDMKCPLFTCTYKLRCLQGSIKCSVSFFKEFCHMTPCRGCSRVIHHIGLESQLLWKNVKIT